MIKRFKTIFLCLTLILSLLPLAATASSYFGASSWAVPELDKAANYGLITDRIKSNVSGYVTREEFAQIAVKLYETYTGKSAEADDAAFTDTSNPEIFKAANMGLVLGVGDGRFGPSQFVTREQIATILLRTLKVINPSADFSTAGATKFADDAGISGWAREGVYYCSNNGIIKGIGNNMFGPASNSTREAAVILCVRAYELYKFDGVIPTVPTPAPSSGAAAIGSRISVGDSYCMAILNDDSLWGWGFDNGIHFGLRNTGHEFVDKPAKIMDNAKAVFAGWGTTLVIKNDNTLWAWGDNMPGAGEDRLAFALKPEKIMDNVVSAACGHWFVLAVKADGSLWAWGDNKAVKLKESLAVKDDKGANFRTPVVTPLKLMDGVKQVGADGNSYYILKKDGTLLFYGGKLSGSGTVTASGITFDKMAPGVKDAAMTEEALYYIKNDNSLWGFGKKVHQGIGIYEINKESAYDYTPVKVMDNVKAVAVSPAFTPMALTTDGKLITWGMTGEIDTFFSKGTTDWTNFDKKKTLQLMSDVRAIAGGTAQYLAEKNDGSVWVWGINESGGGSGYSNTLGTDEFIKLDFSPAEGQLFTTCIQKSKLLSDWLREKEASGEIPPYNGGFTANWQGYWSENVLLGLNIKQSGKNVYGYDSWGVFYLIGTVDGNKLRGHINGGIFELTMMPDGKLFTGLYFENSAAEAWEWKGTKTR